MFFRGNKLRLRGKIGLIGALFALHTVAHADSKLAVVIGNSQYQAANDYLANPVNDAQAVARRFEQLGYKTKLLLNADLRTMSQTLSLLPNNAGGTIVFYYAGHGIQIDQRNYLVPTDAKMDDRDMVEKQTLSVREVLERLQRTQSSKQIVILDACRNDPFPKSYRSGTRGLSRETLVATRGQMILYAASANEVADDGRSGHGVFTQALLQQLQTPNLELPKLFDQVADQVSQQTYGKQNPYSEGQGLSSFVFYSAPTAPSANNTPVVVNTVPSRPSRPPNVESTSSRFPEGLSAYNIDFFYCEHKRATSEPVTHSAMQLKSKGYSGLWRVRELSAATNRHSGYQITKNEIRYTPPSETAIATAISQDLAQQGVSITLRPTSYPTPQYISVFICQ